LAQEAKNNQKSMAITKKNKGAKPSRRQPNAEPIPRNTSGFYKKIDLESIDGRTTLGKAVKEIKTQLREYVGDNRTLVAEILIGRIAYKVVRLCRYEINNLENPADQEVPHFLPLANSLRLDLIALQQMAGETKPPTLDDFLFTNYGKAGK
jgi:hypothetical protein